MNNLDKKINFYMNEGRKIIETNKLQNWNKIVCTFISQESLLKCSLNVIDALNKGIPTSNIQNILSSYRINNYSLGILKNIVMQLSPKGKEFCNNVNIESPQNINTKKTINQKIIQGTSYKKC